jgi:predicted DNA-binding antitoxin AbrB/MazE fold protein
MLAVKSHVEAVFQDGVFKPATSPELRDGERVRLTVERVPSAGPDEILALAGQVYAGFNAQEVDEVEALALRRPLFDDAR